MAVGAQRELDEVRVRTVGHVELAPVGIEGERIDARALSLAKNEVTPAGIDICVAAPPVIGIQ